MLFVSYATIHTLLVLVTAQTQLIDRCGFNKQVCMLIQHCPADVGKIFAKKLLCDSGYIVSAHN